MEFNSAVVKNLLKRRDKSNGYEEVRPLLMILGGGMLGAYGAGSAMALCRLGLSAVFDNVVTISTGCPIGAYFLAGERQWAQGASFYYEECTSKSFINVARLKKIINIDFVVDRFRAGAKKLDVEAVSKSGAGFFVVATTTSGASIIIDAKTAEPDMIAAIHASMAIPIFYGKTVKVNGQQLVDGSFDPFPIEKVVRRFHPTDIIVLPNHPDQNGKDKLSLSETLFASTLLKKHPVSVTKMTLARTAKFREALRYVESSCPANVEILWPPDTGLTPLTQNAKRLKQAEIESAKLTCKVFGEPNCKVVFL